MFEKACETVKQIASTLHDGWTYRGEYLMSPSHNTLHYDRTPAAHIILFDVETSLCTFLTPIQLTIEAERIGLEYTPFLVLDGEPSVSSLEALIDSPSVLGGQKMEGLVVKNYERFGPDGKVLMAKHVSEKYKEIHDKSWKAKNPAGGDVITKLVERYKTEARWQKAIQHLAEFGSLLDDPKDIGPLMKEVGTDTYNECGEEIKEILFKWAWPKISRGITGGLPEWYKDLLLAKQFDDEGWVGEEADMYLQGQDLTKEEWDVDKHGTGPLTGDY
jgi:hypothetical protein